MEDIQVLYEEVITKYNQLLGMKASDLKLFNQYSKETDSYSDLLDSLNKVKELLKKLHEVVSVESLGVIEEVVNNGLLAVFERDYKFKVLRKINRGAINYTFTLMGEESSSFTSSYGGGVLAVIGVLLRILTIVLMKPEFQRILVLDETLAMLSRKHLESMAELLKILCEKFDLDILLISHSKEYSEFADNIYFLSRVEKSSGHYAKVEKIKKAEIVEL